MQLEALKTAQGFEREARRRIQHMNIAAADLDLRAANKNPSPFDEYMDNNGLLRDGPRELRSR